MGESQNKLTQSYLNTLSFRDNLKRRIEMLNNYEKMVLRLKEVIMNISTKTRSSKSFGFIQKAFRFILNESLYWSILLWDGTLYARGICLRRL